MSENLYFEPGYYKITKLIEPNVLEVEGTWFIKLKGVGDHLTKKEGLNKWLRENHIVRVIPHSRRSDARIISDVWLGNTHINRQFPDYKKDNFIQAFEEWDKNRSTNPLLSRETAEELIEAFYMAESLIPSSLRSSFKNWLETYFPQKRTGAIKPSIDEIIKRRENAQKKMCEDFDNWRKK